MDDDCDGNVDEGNPGGNVICAVDVGACISRTACVGGVVICRGTFVATPGAGGSTTNPGSPSSPLSTIAAAQANAVILGGGADVCVCDPTSAGASTFPENVVMIEGTSVLGNYDCATWTRTGGATTVITDIDADGVNFPAGITNATSLEQFGVLGLSLIGGGGNQSQAITINGAPQMLNVTVGGGAAPTSIAIECVGCGGTVLSNVLAGAGAAVNLGLGLHGTGTLTGLSVASSTFSGGTTSSNLSVSSGVRLEGCAGSPTFMTSNTFGGGTPTAPYVGTRTGFEVSGAMCAPAVTGGNHTGCEVGGITCIGVSCSMGAQCSFTGSLAPNPGAGGIRGSQSHVQSCIGVQCLSGGCARFVNNTINAGFLLGASTVAMGFQIDGASPVVDRNTIVGPQGGILGPMMGRFYGLYLHNTTSLVTNNIILDGGSWSGAMDVVRFDQSSIGPALLNPIVHSNTIQYTSCSACGPRVGLGLASSPAGASPQGIFRNNIFDHAGAGGVTRAVVEYNPGADPLTFENNDMNDTVIYFDEGSTPLTLAMVNALGAGYSSNIAGTCNLTVTQHLPGTASACYDTGSAVGAPPNHDFDNQSRPFSVLGAGAYDIGADEFHP